MTNIIQPCCLENMRQMLLDVVRIFDNNNLHYWLDYGALLGITRGNDLISYDKDIDFGIFEEDYAFYKDVVASQIVALGKYKVNTIDHEMLLSKDNFIPRIWPIAEHCTNIVCCDIFVYGKANQKWKDASKEECPDLSNKIVLLNCRYPVYCDSFYYTQLETMCWQDTLIKVPKNRESYLAMRYGCDWKTPDKKFYTKKKNGSI